MGILLCEQNFRNVWIRNESVRAEIGQILHTDTHPHTHTTAAKLVVRLPFLQIRKISEMAGAACHGEGYQCPARWMSLTRAECHSYGGPRAGSEGETPCRPLLHFGEELFATVGAACRQTIKHGYDALNMRN